MKITVDMITGICINSIYTRETHETVEETFEGREYLTVRDISYLGIPVANRIWVLSHLLGTHDPTRSVARKIVVDIMGDIDMPPEYTAWLNTGFERLREQAMWAAWRAPNFARLAAQDVAEYAAWGAALDAARRTVRTADATYESVLWGVRGAALRKYMGWMVEYLEGIKA